MASSSDEKVVTKRKSTPRKRVVKKRTETPDKVTRVPRKTVVKKTAPKKRAPRKTVSRKVKPKKVMIAATEQPVLTDVKEELVAERKAPTVFAGQQVAQKNKKRQMIVVASLLVLGLGSSAAVGYTDVGQIDVAMTIEARNERIRTNTANANDFLVSQIEVPVQDTPVQQKADGGLLGRGTGGAPPAPAKKVEVGTSTATSSIKTATSSDQIASSTEKVATSTTEVSARDDVDAAEIKKVAVSEDVLPTETAVTDVSTTTEIIN